MSIGIYPDSPAIVPETLSFLADYAEFEALSGGDIMEYQSTDPHPATQPFNHPDTGQIWQIFFTQWRAEQRLIANIRHEDPDRPQGYWIDYTTAPNYAIKLKQLANRTILHPEPPSDEWITVTAISPYYGMSITNPSTFASGNITLVGVTEEWDTFYRFENPDWPDHYFEFQTNSYHPNIWPKRAFYVYWRYLRNNGQWYWSTYLQRRYANITPMLTALALLSLCGAVSVRPPARRPNPA